MADLIQAFEVLAVAYPRDFGRYDEEQIAAWLSLLEDADPESVLRAARQLAASSKWAPTVAEIREAAGAIDPGTAARRAASSAAAARHDAWVAEQERRATAEARERLIASGVDPDRIKPVDVATLIRGIGH